MSMTKTEIKSMKVDDLRDFLSEYFDGITDEHTKSELEDILDVNWDFLKETLDAEEKAEKQAKAALTSPNPATDLFSGHMRG